LNKSLLADYWQKTVDRTVEKWRFAETDASSAFNDFGGFFNASNFPNVDVHCNLTNLMLPVCC
jgi:hypothetical protein